MYDFNSLYPFESSTNSVIVLIWNDKKNYADNEMNVKKSKLWNHYFWIYFEDLFVIWLLSKKQTITHFQDNGC